MHGAFSGDTIVAISTSLGESGIGIVRLSGPRAVRIAEAIFQPARAFLLSQVPTHTI
ncbi:tRNA uridine-5-carboxymethylaminomethyl(34) synthesis GTPase MnmE, partial [Candidatus Bipolaricaulota bacterium]|nr:tRNA uridine-5-carboxymethylaminomethyl(34) synthesis GTPase MnmE [Candidatus Bipolaricaulota bacterium]